MRTKFLIVFLLFSLFISLTVFNPIQPVNATPSFSDDCDTKTQWTNNEKATIVSEPPAPHGANWLLYNDYNIHIMEQTLSITVTSPLDIWLNFYMRLEYFTATVERFVYISADNVNFGVAYLGATGDSHWGITAWINQVGAGGYNTADYSLELQTTYLVKTHIYQDGSYLRVKVYVDAYGDAVVGSQSREIISSLNLNSLGLDFPSYDIKIYFDYFVIGIPVTLTITKPQNITYTTSTIPVELNASGGTIDKIWYNCKSASWIYESNQTYTNPTSMTGFENGTYQFYAWANNTDFYSDSKNVSFTVSNSPIPSIAEWFMTSDTHTVNNKTGYQLAEHNTISHINKTESVDGDVTVYYGCNISILHKNGEATALSNIVYSWRAGNGTGLQNILWTAPATTLNLGFDALQVELYIKFAGGGWQLIDTFITEPLLKKSIVSTEWTLQIYTQRSTSETKTYGSVLWGNSNYPSGIANIEFVDPSSYELMLYKIQNGDYVGFVLHPYLAVIGPLFYGWLMLIACVPLYIRYRSLTPILLLFIIFGGAGGIFSLMTPEAGLGFSWIFLLFGLAGLFYKVFR